MTGGRGGPADAFRERFPGCRIRLLLITHELTPGDHAGFRDAFDLLQLAEEIESFAAVAPAHTIARFGQDAAREELAAAARLHRPNVVLVTAPRDHEQDLEWVRSFVDTAGRPLLVFWEGDAFGRFTKPPSAGMHAWLAASDVVFSVAGEPQMKLFRRAGARDVRLIPNTYCHLTLREAEDVEPESDRPIDHDAVLIGSGLARWGRVSRMPGAVARADLVRRLQRSDLRIAIYGPGWHGRGARGPLPWPSQVAAIRRSLTSVNWDHFPRHEDYFSNRLPIALLAGRVHVTTAHPTMRLLPPESTGLFTEPDVASVVRRVRELVAAPTSEILALGMNGHRWAKERMSHRVAARFMLGCIDERLLDSLPSEPWKRLAAEWER